MEQPSEKNLIKMRTYAEKFAEKSGTYLHPDHGVTDVVVEGLARHIEEVGKPLCPCNFYPDKAAEAKLRRWICACDEMQIYKYCHRMAPLLPSRSTRFQAPSPQAIPPGTCSLTR